MGHIWVDDDDDDDDDGGVDDVDVYGEDGGNIGCKLMSKEPSHDDKFIDLIINGTWYFFSVCQRACLSVSNYLSGKRLIRG